MTKANRTGIRTTTTQEKALTGQNRQKNPEGLEHGDRVRRREASKPVIEP
jgi:hypothetical protein